MDPQFECPSALPSELIGEFPLAAASRSILYQCYDIYVCLCVCVCVYYYIYMHPIKKAIYKYYYYLLFY